MEIALVPMGDIRPPFEVLRPVIKTCTPYLELKDSMSENGLLNSIKVRPMGGKYEVILGNHRFHAAQDLGWETIPCIIEYCSDEDVLIQQIEDNACRKDTTDIEYAMQFQRFIDWRAKAGIQTSYADIARSVHKHSKWVKNILSLLRLSPEVQKLVEIKELSLTTASILAKLPPCYHDQFIGHALKLSARDFELLVAEFARTLRGEAGERRREMGALRDSEMHPKLRNLVILEKELDNPENCAKLIVDAGAKTAMEGAKIALAWVLQLDADSQKTRTRTADKRKFWNRWSKEYREKLNGDVTEIMSIDEFFDDFLRKNKHE